MQEQDTGGESNKWMESSTPQETVTAADKHS